MKSLEFNQIEDYLATMNNEDILEQLELLQMILKLGIQVENDIDIDSINDIVAGNNLIIINGRLTTKHNLLSMINEGAIDLYKRKNCLDLLKDFGLPKKVKITQINDLDVLYESYKNQWYKVYKAIISNIKNDKLDAKTKKHLYENYPLIKNIEDLKYYEDFYNSQKSGYQKVIVNISYLGNIHTHIYINLDWDTGVPEININKLRTSNGNSDRFSNFRKLFMPLGVLRILMEIPDSKTIFVTDKDLILHSNIGKLSGFEVGSIPDKKIFEFLKVNKLYETDRRIIN